MAGIGAVSLGAVRNPGSPSGRLESLPVQGAFSRQPNPERTAGLDRGLWVSLRRIRRPPSGFCSFAIARVFMPTSGPTHKTKTPAAFCSIWIGPRLRFSKRCEPMVMSHASCCRPPPVIFRRGFTSADCRWNLTGLPHAVNNWPVFTEETWASTNTVHLTILIRWETSMRRVRCRFRGRRL